MFKKKVELKPMVISEASYTIRIRNFSDGHSEMSRTPEGFKNDFELMGLLNHVVGDIQNNMINNNKDKKKAKK